MLVTTGIFLNSRKKECHLIRKKKKNKNKSSWDLSKFAKIPKQGDSSPVFGRHILFYSLVSESVQALDDKIILLSMPNNGTVKADRCTSDNAYSGVNPLKGTSSISQVCVPHTPCKAATWNCEWWKHKLGQELPPSVSAEVITKTELAQLWRCAPCQQTMTLVTVEMHFQGYIHTT